ncbi:hypothetical protein QJS04_geneDACA001776 [Acorus gramineus]|uniref:Uncharacterized protein n=1 Tax=Acorus gramineus TaxID=55184 RepID=A0AAV9BH21_ACOGR|nr:hypothetical protein QJS04_geneDACA001776 [Acorus gramineus]
MGSQVAPPPRQSFWGLGPLPPQHPWAGPVGKPMGQPVAGPQSEARARQVQGLDGLEASLGVAVELEEMMADLRRISMEDSFVIKGKESLLIPVQAQITHASLIDRCPHRSEIQSIALVDVDNDTSSILGSVDSYGHLIVSRLDATGTGYSHSESTNVSA